MKDPARPSESQGERDLAADEASAPQKLRRLLGFHSREWFREHPIFQVPQATPHLEEQAPPQTVTENAGTGLDGANLDLSGAAQELEDEAAARQAHFELELTRILRQRISLMATITVLVLPFFTILFYLLSPRAGLALIGIHGAFLVTAFLLVFFSRRLSTLRAARLLALSGYAVAVICASLVLTVTRDDRIIIDSGHLFIMLSMLLMPFTWPECAFVAILCVGSYAFTLRQTLASEHFDYFLPHLGVFGITGVILLYMVHQISLMRRLAFENSFVMARTLSQSQQISYLDSVTGGYNRRYLELFLEREIGRSTRHAKPLSILMFDLDNFKAVNDCCGHVAGDHVLRVVWQAAERALRREDLVARYGGDEFVVVLPETGGEMALMVAHRLRDQVKSSLATKFASGSEQSRVTLSLGVLPLELKERLPISEALRRVDEKLYAAKAAGKNRVVS